MKYQQPYGMPPEVTWGDTPYINGNPSTGTAGSIPPAASIEYPQREIVNLIKSGPLAPSDSDLQQLARTLQSGAIWCGNDAGTSNAYQVTLTPPPLAYYPGMCVLVKIAHDNTGPSVLNVNAIGPQPIKHHDATDLGASELITGAYELFTWTGTFWELCWSTRAAGGGGPIYLTRNMDYYINGNTGNDSYDGLTAAYTSGIHGPFKTLQKAADQIPLYNLNNYSVTMHVADGAYNDQLVCRRINGVGFVFWQGNSVAPQNVTIMTVNKTAVRAENLGGTYYFEGFRIGCTGTSSIDSLSSMEVYGSTSIVILGTIDFMATQGAHISTQGGAMVSNYNPGSPWRIFGSALGSSFMNGSFIFAWVQGNSINNSNGGPAVTVMNPITLAGAFITCMNNSFVQLANLAGGSVAGGGSVTGQKFTVDYNSEIMTGGAGINFYPGTIAGSQGPHGGYYS
jgi:hypothetical protein